MCSRMLQVNKLLQQELANLISSEIFIENCLITVTSVKCSNDLKNASVFVTILPENQSGTALKLLRKNSKPFSGELKKKLKLKYIPNFQWKIDSQEKHANELNEYITNM